LLGEKYVSGDNPWGGEQRLKMKRLKNEQPEKGLGERMY